jgi:hypothetical protein
MSTPSNATTTTVPAGRTQVVVEHLIGLLTEQVLDGVVDLYAPDATWEIHVPDWDGFVTDPAEMRELYAEFFGHDAFRVERRQIVAEGGTVALRWDLSWRDPTDGATCVSFQSHFFEVEGERIHRHAMYCAGVRAFAPD